ncbi:MAG: erythromycin esterase family protein [Hyphomicrobiaceae bacterium]
MDEAVRWIQTNAIPLATAEAGNGFADLEPLRAAIGEARIVSLGEATHGTREFFQLKHRLLEFCVSELGFTVFGIEASLPESLAVNDYVLHGTGDPADGLASMRFWTWDTEEVLTLIEWMRTWNKTHDRKVKFYGFDMQFPTVATLGLLTYLQRVAPDLAAASEGPLAPLCADFNADRFDFLPAGARDAAFAAIERILAAFARERAAWVRATGALDWDFARLHAIVLEQSARLRAFKREGFAIRDRAMADNIGALLDVEEPKTKIVLWAHNGHAQRAPYVGADTVAVPNMGGRLHEIFGRDHIVVGFAFDRGSFQAIGSAGLMSHTVPPMPEGSLDAALAKAGIPIFALDLRTVPAAGPVSDWFASKPASRSIGALYDAARADEFLARSDPRHDFDLLMFVETTTRARPNRTGVRSPSKQNEVSAKPVNLALAGTAGVPDGWDTPGSTRLHAHTVALSDEPSPSGGRTVRIARASAPWAWGEGTLSQEFSTEAWQSKRLRFSAAVRVEAEGPGTGAQLFVEVSPKPQDDKLWLPSLAVATTIDRPVRSPLWATYAVETDIPAAAHSVVIGFVVTGNGTGWFGDVTLEAV